MSEIIINYLLHHKNNPNIVKLVAKLYGVTYFKSFKSLIKEINLYDKILNRMINIGLDRRYSVKDYQYFTQREILRFLSKNNVKDNDTNNFLAKNLNIESGVLIREYAAKTLANTACDEIREKYHGILLKTNLENDPAINYYNYQNPSIHWDIFEGKNEDRFAHLVTEDIKIFAVFDGHGGQLVSQYLSDWFLYYVQKKILEKKFENSDIAKILKSCFKNFNTIFKISQGSTATLIIIYEDVLYCANCGDTIAAMRIPFNENKVVLLSEIHGPESEKIRLNKLGSPIIGGRIMCKENRRLNMSRSFGDYHCKSAGMISLCHVTITKLIPNKNYHILICTDGLYRKNEALNYAEKFLNYIVTEPKRDKINLPEILTSPEIVDDKTISYINFLT